MIEKEIINEILAKTDIIEVVSRFREVKKNGANYFIKSPFVDEKTPSCAVNSKKGIYKCFSSGKSGNAISYLMDAEGFNYIDAVKLLADIVGMVITDASGKIVNEKPKADYQKRKATPEEEEGAKYFEIKTGFTLAELKTIFAEKIIKHVEYEFKKRNKNNNVEALIELVYAPLFKTLKKYNVYACSEIRFIKNRDAHIFKSNDKYPIFVFDNDEFFKFYQPKHEDKAMRFLYGGAKPSDFIFGYAQTCNAYAEKDAATKNEAAEIDEEGEEKSKPKKDTRLDAIIECTGERDALNVAALGYEIICLATESAVINAGKLATLMGKTKAYYRLPDIDLAGKESNHRVCMCTDSFMYLEIKTIQLPQSLKLHKDFRGNSCKDVRDFLQYYAPKNFHDLVLVAIPYRFWDFQKAENKDGSTKIKFGKPVIQYVVNNVHMYNFLAQNGYYRYKTESKKDGYSYISIKGNIVSEIDTNDIKGFLNSFLEERKLDVELRNTFYRSNQLNDTSFSNLPYTDLDFNDYDKKEQFFFFKNKTWKVTPNQIEEFKTGGVNKFVWNNEVVQHDVKLLPDFFTVTKTDVQDYDHFDITVNDTSCLFFKYLINTSRIHWRKELEENITNLSPLEREKYVSENKFTINGALLTKEEQHEQKLHLINKMYSLGYLLHRYKDPSRPWAIFAMDNKVSDDGESHGGSGKSLAYKAIRYFMTSIALDGRNPKLTENPHIYERVTLHTDFILVDDANQYLKFNFFFAPLTGELVVNPKNNKQYEIPFKDVPKFAITSNYTLRDIDPSTERRLLYTVFSDYYHFNSSSEYNESRSPKDDLNKNLFLDFTEEEWNLFINFMAQCCKLYMNFDKIEPPMDNVTARNLQAEMGMSFNAWADVYFSTEGGRLNKFVIKEDAFKDFITGNKLGWSSQKFTKAIKAWCRLNKLIYDPKDLQNTQGRIIRKAKKTIWKNGNPIEESVSVEMIYIQEPGKIIKEEEETVKAIDFEPTAELF